MSENEKLRGLLKETMGGMAKHQFNQESPTCTACFGEVGVDVGKRCPKAPDYDLLNRIDRALGRPVERTYSQEVIDDMAAEMTEMRKRYESISFKRGAEAMREAAAKYIEVASPTASVGGITLTLAGTSNKIRALPIPEDK
jgi:hypothetical protein